jgi:hypothetical protein
MEKKNHATVYLPEFFSTGQTLLIWRVPLHLTVGHSIYELIFHPRNAGVALFALSGGAALRNLPITVLDWVTLSFTIWKLKGIVCRNKCHCPTWAF